ncbi:MAG: hypothetical protein ACR2J1_00875 [Methyloceanibacter sp.]|uniref:hypothetical protein n=1 Tax=Methyloceanibacter sp. TaxID=1965321 RepID=UPI003D9BE5F0
MKLARRGRFDILQEIGDLDELAKAGLLRLLAERGNFALIVVNEAGVGREA